MDTKTVLVTGATGQQGGAVARALLKKNHRVHALTRKPQSPAAQELSKLGIKIIAGNFDERYSLELAMRDADAVFAVGTPFEAGTEAEVRQGIVLTEMAYNCAVSHFVYTSVAAADQNTGIPHFDSKYSIEQHILSFGIPYTIIAPAFFMENLRGPWWLPGLLEGQFSIALPAWRNLQMVALDNIGEFAATVIDRRDPFLGKRIELAGDEIEAGEVASIVADILGRNIEFTQMPIEKVRAMSNDLAFMFEWFDSKGYSVDIAGLRRRYPEIGWLTFRQWAETCDWTAVEQLVPA